MPSQKNSPLRAYITQKAKATQRGLSWEFTFDTWWKVWEESGLWEKRGRRRGQFVMARIGDKGEYGPNNVTIEEAVKNNADGMNGWRERQRIEQGWPKPTRIRRTVPILHFEDIKAAVKTVD